MCLIMADGGPGVMGAMLLVSVRKDPDLVCPARTPGTAGLPFGLPGRLAGRWEGRGLRRRGHGRAAEVASGGCPTP